MSAYEPNSRHLRENLIFCFNMKKSATEPHPMLSNTYGEAAISERTCLEWFQRFKNGEFDVEDQHDICCQVIYSQFGLAIHQNDHQARRRFLEWAQNEIAVVPDFHKRILFSDEAHFWLNGYVNKQNCPIWSDANPQVYVETPLHPEKLTVWGALWAGGIFLQKR
ncbi:mariner Mos1 transposase [Trichonephila clavipes]|nr:mariner Mos1 transposase [Trichonephila clavipes]